MKRLHIKKRNQYHGFTLLEIMVVVIIIAVLAAFAVPSYQRYILRADRAQARVTLMEAAQAMDRYYTTNYTYVGYTLPTSLQSSPPNGTPKFTITVVGTPSISSYTLKATSVNGDDECATMTLNQAGIQQSTGSATVAECWNR